MSEGILLLGTRKGAFILRANRERQDWHLAGPHFLGSAVHHAVLDPRDSTTVLVSAKPGHLGPTLFRSGDLGEHWQEASRPPAFGRAENGATGASVDHVFWLAPGHVDEAGVWYAGTSPPGLFRSEDGGDTWQEVRGFNTGYYPGIREHVGEVPGGALLHSIGIDPRDPDTLWVFPMDGTATWPRTPPDGRPAAYRSRDGGASWERQDTGLPRAQAWWTVKRQAFCADAGNPVGLYFGTSSGEVWASLDEGASWRRLAEHLPEIYSVEAG